jgi:hypothetical protein
MKHGQTLAIVTLIAIPLMWLWPCVFGDRLFVPYDTNQFSPASITATNAEIAASREGANFDVTEVPPWFLPELKFAGEELRAGRLPTWNPSARRGAPLHAHGLIGLCYPPNWIALFSDDPANKLGLVAWCNIVIGGLLAFGLLRQTGLTLASAWIGAALFELSGPVAANSFFWMRLASLVWLPGILWAMLRIAQSDRLRPLAIAALGVTFAMTWLAGFPPFAAANTLFAGVLFCWLASQSLIREGRARAFKLAATLSVGFILGALWAMPQVLPSLAFFPESSRATVPLWRDISGQAFEPYGLLGYLMPAAFGDPTTTQSLPYGNSPMQLLLNTRALGDGSAALPNYNFTEYSIFISSFGCVLAILGLVFAKGKHVWFARIALFFALGMGLFWPGLQLLYHLPVVQNVWPFRWLPAATIFVAWAAALGFDHISRQPSRSSYGAGILSILAAGLIWWGAGWFERNHETAPNWAIKTLEQHYESTREDVVNHVQGRPPVDYDRFAKGFEQFHNDGRKSAIWLGSIGLLLLGAASMRQQRRRELILMAAAAASLIQLGIHGKSILRGVDGPPNVETEVHAFLFDQVEKQLSDGGFAVVRTSKMPRFPSQLPPGQLMHPQIGDLNFYSHADARTLMPLRRLLDTYQQPLGLRPNPGERIAGEGYLTQSLPAALLQHPFFDLMGVRFALSTEGGLSAPPYLVGERVGPKLRGRGEFFIYERSKPMPRAYVVNALTSLQNDEAVLAAITNESLQPSGQAYVVATEAPSDVPLSTPDAAQRIVKFSRSDPTNIELDISAGKGRFLVLTDTLLPGWHATIDDHPTEIIRCNHSQKLVVIPDKACRVTFHYQAPGLSLGLSCAILATVLAIAAVCATRRRQQLAKPGPQA